MQLFIKINYFYIILLTIFNISAFASERTLLHVSYDPTRELYKEINAEFVKYWLIETGEKISVKQSHGASTKQARSVIDGLEADIVSLASRQDVDYIANNKLISQLWPQHFKNEASPYSSTIVLVVRKDNNKQIKDWDDLVKDGVQVITPNPKTSGGAKWNYIAAWHYALKQYNNDEQKAKEFITKLYKNVPILSTAARGATMNFTQRKVGDVLVAWENEALLITKKYASYTIIIPSTSIMINLPVAVVEYYARKHGNEDLAKAYIDFLYSDIAQEIMAKNHYRPFQTNTLVKHKFYDINFTQENSLNNFADFHQTHFGDDGIFDQIYENN